MNLDFLCYPIGWLVKLLYDIVSIFDSKILSAYAISIILSTILFKLVLMPLTLKQTKSMKIMQDMNPKVKELQKKYEKDPQTLQRKQMELYKEANYNPMSGCLPMLLQFPILIAFFYVIREPVQFVFHDQTTYDQLNKVFFWIKDLGLNENTVSFFKDNNWINIISSNKELISKLPKGMYKISELLNIFNADMIKVNGLSLFGYSVPFIGAAVPILAAISGYSTYLTSKMTAASQPSMGDQQASTQKTMTTMMPIMLFVFSLQFPAGLALYWVISNLFQVAQQWVVLNSSKKTEEELK